MDQDLLNILNDIDRRIETLEEVQKNLNDLKERTEQMYEEALAFKQRIDSYKEKLKYSKKVVKNS